MAKININGNINGKNHFNKNSANWSLRLNIAH